MQRSNGGGAPLPLGKWPSPMWVRQHRLPRHRHRRRHLPRVAQRQGRHRKRSRRTYPAACALSMELGASSLDWHLFFSSYCLKISTQNSSRRLHLNYREGGEGGGASSGRGEERGWWRRCSASGSGCSACRTRAHCSRHAQGEERVGAAEQWVKWARPG